MGHVGSFLFLDMLRSSSSLLLFDSRNGTPRLIVVGRTAQFSGIFCCGGAVDRDSRRVRKGSTNDICVVKVLIVVPVSVSESTDVGTVLLLGVF